MTAVVQSPDRVDAEALEGDTVLRNLPAELEELLLFPEVTHTQRAAHAVRDREWTGRRDHAPSFSPHWAQIQLALAFLLWGSVFLVISMLTSGV